MFSQTSLHFGLRTFLDPVLQATSICFSLMSPRWNFSKRSGPSRSRHLFGLCSPSYFHLFFAYASALKLQQEVSPAQVAVAEEVRRKRLHYANAFNLLRPAQAHVARKLGVMVRTCEWTQRLKALPRARARKCKNKSHSRADESTLFGGLFSDRLL